MHDRATSAASDQARLPDGYRKCRIRAVIYDVVAPSLPVLPYTARSNNLMLVTRNTGVFDSIPGLPLENWFA